MAARRAARFALEVLFLAALAAALTFAHLRSIEVVGLMLLGWAFVTVFEWGALRSRSHYASGLPPRWYVPPVSLPPPRPLEQVGSGYPASETAADAATWIASPAMLADWLVVDSPLDEQTQVHDMLEVELAIAVSEAPSEEPARSAVEPEPLQGRQARHQIDPLEKPAPKGRRFGRRQDADLAYAVVPARPGGSRSLPSRSTGDD